MTMATAIEFNRRILQPALRCASPIIAIPRSAEADQMLLTIAGKESAWRHRYQLSPIPGSKGPARGFWQFERNGGVAGVMTHRSTADRAADLVSSLGLPWDRGTIWQALETDDVLAVGFARLLLWTDPRPLPTERGPAWLYYLKLWRPGKPHPDRWPAIWSESEAATA